MAVNTCDNPRWREPRPCNSWGQVAHVLTPDNFRLSPGQKKEFYDAGERPVGAGERNKWHDGTRVMVRNKYKSWAEATIYTRLDAEYWRVQYPAGGTGMFADGDAGVLGVARPGLAPTGGS